jgi:hypothetical protein
MSTESRDPILRGLDELAGLADTDQVGDRMAGISRKARTTRIRRGAAGVACLAVIAAATTYTLVSQPGGDSQGKPGPATNPTVATESTDPSSPADPEQVVTDEAAVDLDGDGRADQVRLLVPQPDTTQGDAAKAFAEVTRASGETTEIPLYRHGTPTVAGSADLNSDGVREVEIRSEGEHHTWWTVLTFSGGEVVAATPILSGAEWVVEPESGSVANEYAGDTFRDYQLTWLRGDQLVTWFTGRAWDEQSSVQVRQFPWSLDGDELSLGGQVETVCVTADPTTWTDPQPC